jgi:hypothetical protein
MVYGIILALQYIAQNDNSPGITGVRNAMRFGYSFTLFVNGKPIF